MTDWTRHRPVIGYFVIAFGLSWAVWIPMALVGARVYQGHAWPSHLPGLFGPMAAALIMSALVGGGAGVRNLLRRMVLWHVAGTWYLAALSPLVFYAVAVIILGILGKGWPDLAEMGKFSGLPMVVFPVMWLLLLVTAYAEETGWRGFAAHEVLKTRNFLWTAVVVGLLWALWHVPSMFVIENYREMGIAMIPMFTLGIVSGSILLTWLYRGSGGSIFLVAVWHASYNLVSGTAAASGVKMRRSLGFHILSLAGSRDGLAILLLAVSTLGVALNGVIFPRLGRMGGMLQVASTGIPFGRGPAFGGTWHRGQHQANKRSKSVLHPITSAWPSSHNVVEAAIARVAVSVARVTLRRRGQQ